MQSLESLAKLIFSEQMNMAVIFYPVLFTVPEYLSVSVS